MMQLTTLTSANNRWSAPASSAKNAKMEESVLPHQVMFSKAQGKISFIDKARLIVALGNTPKCPMLTGKIQRQRVCSARLVWMAVVRPRTRLIEWAVRATNNLNNSSNRVVNTLKWATSRIQTSLTRDSLKVKYSSLSQETTFYLLRWMLSLLHWMMVDSKTLALLLTRTWVSN